MGIEYRSASKDELGDFIKAASRAFGRHATERDVERGHTIITPERSTIAVEGRNVTGTFMSYAFNMNVPGATLPNAGVAWVTVQPTHRRRGILTGMMRHHLAETHERGEPLACLWPSESIIYGRFGFGMACMVERWTVERPHSALAFGHAGSGTVRFVEPDEAREMFPPVYEKACKQRIGMLHRDPVVWNAELEDRPESRRGMSQFFLAVYEGSNGVEGYVKYRTDPPQRKMLIVELMSTTSTAHEALWRFCLGVDLIDSVEALMRPQDDPLLWMVADPERVRRILHHSFWLRLVDVQEALSRRTYSAEGRVVIEVGDEICPWNHGTYALEGGPEGAACRPVSESPDVTLQAADLGAAYLGGTSFVNLKQAGRVQEHSPGALHTLNTMFTNDLKPWCAQDF